LNAKKGAKKKESKSFVADFSALCPSIKKNIVFHGAF
jgi:hypothetical protein